MGINKPTGTIIEEAIRVHKELGPGLLESVYEEALSYCLEQRGLRLKRQEAVPVYFENIKMNVGFRADLIVENKVVVEIKSIEQLSRVHSKIVFTDLSFTNIIVALIINFNVAYLKEGIKRVVRNFNSASSAPSA